jgi:hypothetical protein
LLDCLAPVPGSRLAIPEVPSAMPAHGYLDLEKDDAAPAGERPRESGRSEKQERVVH